MQRSILTLAALAALAVPALAQTTVTGQPAQPGNNSAQQQGQSAVSRPNTDAMPQGGTTGSVNMNAKLEPGANSFTEGQVRSRLQEAGFKDIQGLQKGENGIWRAQVQHMGQQMTVGLDYKGNVGMVQ
ncbi:hypothetical protein [Salinarimonas soli]|uniref:PepSY domain-containing protein n=1 Tax=Salinarimonas soli TaxID=1638099 RepID=A0A5B2VI33_9HYPH|nr:hypothetical protein [Salinarimonas soli]KAA2238216.1 hypothetical protein F0L46_06095 [Salinarimonas soli]